MKVLAWVIGNDNYTVLNTLDNAVNDAESVSAKFKELGFKVLKTLDIKQGELDVNLEKFKDELKYHDSSIFYYAGHAFQVDNKNYLASIDCPTPDSERGLEYYSYNLDKVLDVLKYAKRNVNIIIIDACRNNPLPDGTRGNIIPSLSTLNAPKGTLIAYSTSPGEIAKDGGMGKNSIYTGTFLKYLDQEYLSAETLFKNVRKTVYSLTGGKQTTWEHTSLIGDFYFNRGQIVNAKSPYSESVLKDRDYVFDGSEIDNIIEGLKSCDWNRQNPAIDKFTTIGVKPNEINKDKQFLLGRNILQSSTAAFNVNSFVENLGNNISKYSIEGENHILNGVLFEIYFNSNGEFRVDNFKNYHLDTIFKLQTNQLFEKSFKYIHDTLLPYKDQLYYIPDCSNNLINIDVRVEEREEKDFYGGHKKVQCILNIVFSGIDITSDFTKKHYINGINEERLKEMLSDFTLSPSYLININSNIKILELYDKNQIISF